MTTFPPTGIAACPRNEQPQMLLCEKSNSFQRHQDLPWTEHRLLYQKMSHQMSFTRWTSEMLYPGVSGGTRFASTNSFSLVKSKQFSGKNSMTTLILHACRSTKTNIFFLEVISEPKNPVPEGLFVKPTAASYPKTTQLSPPGVIQCIPHKNTTRRAHTTILFGWSLSYLHGSPHKKHRVAIL